jgi:hypothetical protein
MRPEDEVSDDAEVATASATASPIETWRVARRARAIAAVRSNDSNGNYVVTRRSKLARRESHAAAERQSSNANGCARSGRDRTTTSRQLRLNVDQTSASANRRVTGRRDSDRVESP